MTAGVDPKDVMTTLLGASTGVAGFGLAFLGVAVALLQMANLQPGVKHALEWLSNLSIFAFLAAVLNSILALVWLVVAVANQHAGALDTLYWGSIVIFVVSILFFFGILAILLWLLPHTGVFKVIARRLFDLR